MTITAILQQLHIVVPETVITWVFPRVPDLYSEILNLMQASTGALNFNDALIALACRDLSVPAIASFDTDFDQIPWLRRLSQAGDAPP
jgi:predicted nucleic acid-binding protein